MNTVFDHVFFHANCVDGYASLIVVLDWAVTPMPSHPISYDQPFPVDMDILHGRNILFVDYCPSDEDLAKLVNICNYVVVIDHHKTAAERLRLAVPFVVGDAISYNLATQTERKAVIAAFDMKQSGAVMTWKFLHPGRDVPLFLQYVQDYDLWKFELEESHKINAYFHALPFKVNNYVGLLRSFRYETANFYDVMNRGAAVQMAENKLIESMMRDAREIELEVPGIGPIPMLAVNTPVLQSKLGNELAKKSSSGIGVMFNNVGARTKVSIRSIREVDISPITTAFGGGGHANAGGWSYDN